MIEKTQTLEKMFDRLFLDLAEIKESIRRIHTKLDETTRQTTVNNTAIIYMREQIKENAKKVEKEVKLIDSKIIKSKQEAIQESQSKITIKFYSALLVGSLGLICGLVSIIGVFLKLRLGL